MKKEERQNFGKIENRVLEEEIQQSYLSYAMSVIVSRALPDVRDGMKPVHRRVLYAMGEMGLRASAKFRKSATVVGEVLGKYHPHSDQAAYDTLVRLAQDFALRYPLVNGQGNFGSIDGDSAAAMRYTEVKMTRLAEEMLLDIDKNTVDFMDNYDGTRKEPKVLPAKAPQLLLNGAVGIAVGMATSVPPHNLTELMDATIALIDNPDSTIADLMEHVQGPDFPTGGLIYNPAEIVQAYETGKGKIVMRAVAEIEESKKGGFRILITEIPYQVNKAVLVERIAELVKEKKIVGISDLRDESNKDGIRIVIELKKDSYPKKILNQLFKLTPMQSIFYVNLLALVDSVQPVVLNLKQALEYFILHRQDVVTRRTQFDLTKAQERAHILEGLKIALDNLDAVISTIKKSRTKEEAHTNLMKKFKLSDVQATAIMEMRLQALAGLERQKVEDEYKEKQITIKNLKAILADPKKILAIIRKESQELKEKYGDKRRTKIVKQTLGEFNERDLVPNEEVVVTITRGGYIKRQPINAYKEQHRGGKGIIGMTTKEEDQIEKIQIAKNHDDILFFTNRGRVFRQRVYQVPQSSRIAKGTAMVNLIQLSPEEVVTGILTMPSYSPGDNFIMITKRGVIKKTEANKYANIRNSGLIAINLDEGDELKWIRKSRKGDTVMIITKEGQAIHFDEADARLLGRSTRGVRGIKLRPKDEVVSADIASRARDYTLLVMSEKGLGKRTPLSQYSGQHRGGIGVKTFKVTERTGKVIGAKLVERNLDADVIITSKDGQMIRLALKSVSVLGRVTQGVTLMRMKANDKVASFAVFTKEVEGEIPETPEVNQDSNTPTAKEVKEALAKKPFKVVEEGELEEAPEDEELEEMEEKPETKKPAKKTETAKKVEVKKTIPAKKTESIKPPVKRRFLNVAAKKEVKSRLSAKISAKKPTKSAAFAKRTISGVVKAKDKSRTMAKSSGFTKRKAAIKPTSKLSSRLAKKKRK